MIIDYPAYTKESFIKSLVHFYGSSIADAPMTKSDDDLYLVSLNYCSHYDDDDCGFTYINAKTGETVSDTWTTRGACPSWYSYLRCPIYIAIEKGYVSKQMWDDYCEKNWLELLNGLANMIEKYGIDPEMQRKYHLDGLWLPCTVSKRCRTYKGVDATLIGFVQEYDSYHGKNVWKAKILGNDNQIHTCGISLPKVDWKPVAERMRELISKDVESETELLQAVLGKPVDTENLVDIREKAKEDKYINFMNDKMPKLIEWCKSKAPEKTEEEIKEWAQSIFARKYPRR